MRSARAAYVDLGRGEYHAGRSLDALLAAYRVGARLAWRRFVETGREAGLAPEVLYDLGEAIFAYIDEISAESADGYAQEQSAAAGEAQRRRRRLVRVLAEDPPASEEAIRTAAAAAGWALPRRRRGARRPGRRGRAGGRARRGRGRAGPADRRGRRRRGGRRPRCACSCPTRARPGAGARSRRRSRGARAALGPAVPWPRAVGEPAPRRARRSRSPRDGLIVAEEHLATLLLAADPALGAELAAARLAPLEGLAAAQRERLEATLRAWLDRPGQVQAVAAALGVHPQTVRYRMTRLRELFGERLEDPGGALRARSRAPRGAHALVLRPCDCSSSARRGCSGRTSSRPRRPPATSRWASTCPRSTSRTPTRRSPPCARSRPTRSSTAPPGPTSTARRRRRSSPRASTPRARATSPRQPRPPARSSIQISTDYSFDGTASEPYTESSPTKRDRRLRPHQAGRRARRRRGRDAGLRDRAQLVAVRPARQELRRHDPARSAPSATS